MAESLANFSEALVEFGLVERSKDNKESIEQAIRREISDMSRFLFESSKINDSSKRLMTEGLVNYIIGFYMNIKKNGIENSKEIIQNVISYFLSMDSKYYGELEGTSEDMGDLAKFLNKEEI